MAQRATSLGPKPSLFLVFCFVFVFPFAFIEKPVFPLRKGKFEVSLCFSSAFVYVPLFHFLFLCLSLILFFLLPSCLYLLSFGSMLLSLSLLFFLLCFCFMKRTTSTYSLSNSFSYHFFSDLSCASCSTFKKDKLRAHIFGQEGVSTKRVLFNLCFAKCEKLSFFGGYFLGKFRLMFKFKKHYKTRYFSTFKATKAQWPFLMVINWSK